MGDIHLNYLVYQISKAGARAWHALDVKALLGVFNF